MTASPPGKTGSGGAGSSKPTKRKKAKPAQADKRPGWSLKSGTAPQPRLRFKADDSSAEVQPADIDTIILMQAIRRASTTLDSDGLSRHDFIRVVATELGYERTSKQVAKAINLGLRAASQRGIVVTERGTVYPDCRQIDDYPNEVLDKLVLAAVGRAWAEREQATRQAARYLGFERSGSKIRATIKRSLRRLGDQGHLVRHAGQLRRAR